MPIVIQNRHKGRLNLNNKVLIQCLSDQQQDMCRSRLKNPYTLESHFIRKEGGPFQNLKWPLESDLNSVSLLCSPIGSQVHLPCLLFFRRLNAAVAQVLKPFCL